MKREIVCRKCLDTHCAALAAAARTHGEFFHASVGAAKKDFICDYCGEPIAAGDHCFGWSMAKSESEYWCWEGEFLEQLK